MSEEWIQRPRTRRDVRRRTSNDVGRSYRQELEHLNSVTTVPARTDAINSKGEPIESYRFA